MFRNQYRVIFFIYISAVSEILNIYLGLGKPIPHLKPDLRMGRLSDRHLQVVLPAIQYMLYMLVN